MNLVRTFRKAFVLNFTGKGRNFASQEAQIETFLAEGNFAEALSASEEMLRFVEERLNQNHWLYPFALNWKAAALTELENFSEAIAIYTRALEIQKIKNGTPDDEVAATLSKIAGVYLTAEDYKQGAVFFKECYLMHSAVRGDSHWQTLALKMSYCTCLMKENLFTECEKTLEEIKPLLKENHPRFGFLQALFLIQWGELFALQNQWEKAEDFFIAARDICEKTGEAPWLLSLANQRLGEINFREKAYDMAYDYFSKALELALPFFGKHHKNCFEIQEALKKVEAFRNS